MGSTLAVIGLVVFRDLLDTWQTHQGLRAFKKPPAPRKPKTEAGGGGG